MKLLFCHHQSFARVRRGTERLMEESAAHMAASGHDVTMLSCRPGGSRCTTDRGFRSVELRRWWPSLAARWGVHEHHVFPLQLFVHLLRHRYDLVFCYSYFDAALACAARRWTGVPVVLEVNNLPSVDPSQPMLTAGGRVCAGAVRGSNSVVAFSEFMRCEIRARWGVESTVVPPGVDLHRFPLRAAPPIGPPRIVTTASVDEPRKGGLLLMEAFNQVKRDLPEVQMEVACRLTPDWRRTLCERVEERWRGDVHFTGDGAQEDVFRIYSRATCTVLPSRREPFGLVVVESLASGVPVAGTREGAIPELLERPGIGCLFDPGEPEAAAPTDASALADALVAALALGADPATAGRCRARALDFGWDRVGPRLEALCQSVVEHGRTA